MELLAEDSQFSFCQNQWLNGWWCQHQENNPLYVEKTQQELDDERLERRLERIRLKAICDKVGHDLRGAPSPDWFIYCERCRQV